MPRRCGPTLTRQVRQQLRQLVSKNTVLVALNLNSKSIELHLNTALQLCRLLLVGTEYSDKVENLLPATVKDSYFQGKF